MPITDINAPLFQACLQLQGNLDRSSLSPLNQRVNSTAFLDYVRSPANKAGIVMPDINALDASANLATDENGCYKVQLQYTKKSCGDVARVQSADLGTCDASSICEAGDKIQPRVKHLDLTIDKLDYIKGSISECDYECLCTGETPSQALSQAIIDAAADLELKISNDLLAMYVTEAGNYADGTASNTASDIKDIPMFNFSADGKACIHHAGFAYMKKQARKAKYDGTYKYFGGEVAADWTNLQGLVTPDNGGSVNQGFDYTYDASIDSILDPLIKADGSSYLIAMAPGAFQIAEYYKYRGWRAKQTPTMLKTTRTINGKLYDFILRYDECLDCHTFIIEKRWGALCIPSAIYCNPNNAHKLIYTQSCGPWNCDLFNNC